MAVEPMVVRRGKNMRKIFGQLCIVGLLWIVGSFDLLDTARAQTPSPATAVTKFDGPYAFVSATKLNESFNDQYGCADFNASPLTIVGSQVRYSTFAGTVAPDGDLQIGYSYVAKGGTRRRTIIGHVDETGTVHARITTSFCNYDGVWRKVVR
jgi:hypothetical protein